MGFLLKTTLHKHEIASSVAFSDRSPWSWISSSGYACSIWFSGGRSRCFGSGIKTSSIDREIK